MLVVFKRNEKLRLLELDTQEISNVESRNEGRVLEIDLKSQSFAFHVDNVPVY